MIKSKSSMKNVVFITAICWSILREKWSIRVVSSEILTLAVRFWKSVMCHLPLERFSG